MIAILTKDLMMSASANAAARLHGLGVKSVPSTNKLEELLAAASVSLLLVDLQLPGLDLDQLGATMEQIETQTRPTVVAYAQHVNVELLERAKQASFDRVITRGQLNSSLGALMLEFGNGSG